VGLDFEMVRVDTRAVRARTAGTFASLGSLIVTDMACPLAAFQFATDLGFKCQTVSPY